MKRDMLESLDKRYANAMEDTTYVCATILDPRFKTMLFPDSEAAIDILRSQCLEVKTTESLAEQPKPAKKAKCESQVGGFWDFINDKTNQVTKNDSSHDTEIHAYLTEPCVSSSADPLDYWKCHEEQYPVLKILARKYLSMQSTSVPSERLFSTAGQVISERRARLIPAKAEQILFLNKNIDVITMKQ